MVELLAAQFECPVRVSFRVRPGFPGSSSTTKSLELEWSYRLGDRLRLPEKQYYITTSKANDHTIDKSVASVIESTSLSPEKVDLVVPPNTLPIAVKGIIQAARYTRIGSVFRDDETTTWQENSSFFQTLSPAFDM